MCFAKRTFLRSIRVVVAVSMFFSLGNILHAQSSSGSATPTPTPTDPGPRPTGNEQLTVCPITGAKFPETVCLDFPQPTSVSPAPAAGGAGNIVANGGNLTGLWFQALTVFETTASVNGSDNSGSLTGSISNLTPFILGLGPSFNAESCLACHSQPAVGGSSPGCVPDSQVSGGTFCSNMSANSSGTVTSSFTSSNNPQIVAAADRGATNEIPSFVENRASTGPLLEVRFPSGAGTNVANLGNPATVQPGAVANLFVITGRSDAPDVTTACAIDQIDFQAQPESNIIFRIPIPTFGDGFVENTPDTELNTNATNQKNTASSSEICGASNLTCGINFRAFNLSGNDQTITRFGWKAQNKSLLMFAGEASNVEMGVTNELFPTERTYGNNPNCTNVNLLPEDVTLVLTASQISGLEPPVASGSTTTTSPLEPSVTSVIAENIENDAVFMRLNAAPSICNWNSGVSSTTGFAQCLQVDSTVLNGAAIFGATILGTPPTSGLPNIGCTLCHSDTLTTGPSTTPSLSNKSFHPFSDFALHHMGGLADGVSQGGLPAAGDQFRTAPLWGLGQRLFFLHDGREPQNPVLTGEDPLYNVIQDHCLTPSSTSGFPASEACAVVGNFNTLTLTEQQDVINFLRSL